MTPLPSIYTIQASDAPQHTDRLREILQNMETENRIGGFTVLGEDDDLSPVTENIGEDDLILIVLTNQLETHKEQIENRFSALKSSQPGIKVAEILVDNVVYDNEFLTLPADLKPIRNREDMDSTWSGIEESLKDMFPAKKEPVPVPPTDWSNYLKIAGIIVGIVLIFIVIRGLWSGDNGPEVRPAEPVPAEPVPEEPVPVEPVEPVEPNEPDEGEASLPGEDCLPFNLQNLEVQDDGGQFVVTDGGSRMMIFRTRDKANEAVRIIRHYRLDNQCFAIRPNPGLRYFKTGGDIPSGSFQGEDCIRIRNPQNLTIRESSPDLFQILDGNSIPYAAKSREEAERIIEIVRHYNAGFTCYVERPDPGMVYLRR